jgi:hypothetical protein
MTHLSPEQFVALIDGETRPELAAHVESCAACRSTVEELRHLARTAASDRVPEPSPLFWELFSARVGAAVRADAARTASMGGWRAWRWAWVAVPVTAIVVLAVGAALPPRQGRTVPARPISSVASVPDVEGEPAAAFDAGDAPWVLMTELSVDVAADESAGPALQTAPGAADRALHHLTEAEQVELVKILREEMGETGGAPQVPDGR